MDKRNLIKRFSTLVVALLVALCAVFCLPNVNAYAASGGSQTMPQYYSQLQFESIVAKNANNGSLWSVDWGIRESMGKNYSYNYSSILGASAFGYTAEVYSSVLDGQNRLVKGYELWWSHDLSKLASVMLYSQQMYIYVPQLSTTSFIFRFGMDDYQDYDLNVSFNLVSLTTDGEEYVTSSYQLTDRFQAVNGQLDLNQCMLEVLSLSPVQIPNVVYVTDVKFTFTDIGKEFDDVGTTVTTVDIMYSNGSPNTMSSYLSQYYMPIEDEEVAFPTDWTGWLGKAITGFFSAEIFPGVTFGGIAAAIFGVLILWFILHLFM